MYRHLWMPVNHHVPCQENETDGGAERLLIGPTSAPVDGVRQALSGMAKSGATCGRTAL